MRDLRGKNAIVTGAASGIGLGLATVLARAGVNVGLMDIDPAALESVRNDLASTGVKLAVATVDVSDQASVERAADQVTNELGPIQVVCSNAGVALRAPIIETTLDNFNWLFGVNVVGSFNVIKAFVPRIIASGQPGHLLITVSTSGLYDMPERQNAVYSATKFALMGLARGLHTELRPSGIGVSALCPGFAISNARRSGEHRHARFGGPFSRPDQARQAGGMQPEEVARIAVRGIEDDAFLIITHPKSREPFIERHETLLAELDSWESRIKELGISTTLDPLPPDPNAAAKA
jgi:NAD(P)-dependent dehydrogenase (short-subunit alcohol dehydrogenase family)